MKNNKIRLLLYLVSSLLLVEQFTFAGELASGGKGTTSVMGKATQAVDQPYWASRTLGNQKCSVLKKDGTLVELTPSAAIAECPPLLEYDNKFKSNAPEVVKSVAMGNLKVNYMVGPKVKTYNAAINACKALDPSGSFQLVSPELFLGIMMAGEDPFSRIPKLTGEGFAHIAWTKNEKLVGTDKFLSFTDGSGTDDETIEFGKFAENAKKADVSKMNKDQKTKFAEIEKLTQDGIHAVCAKDLSKK